MADQKISELTALTGANVADTDLLPIVDTSATETKKITFGEFKTALDTATGFVRITGDTMTGALTTTGLTVAGNLSVDGGTIKLDGNYPVGTGNVALGDAALDSNVSGASNVAIGADALTANTASNNTAVGYQALYANTTGAANTAVGQQALKGNAVGELNTAVGVDSLLVATGSRNTVVGVSAGSQITTGSKNSILGMYNGNQGGLDIRTSDNNIVLSDGDGNPRVFVNSAGKLLVGCVATPNVGLTGQFGFSVSSTEVVISNDSDDGIYIRTTAAASNAIRFYNANNQRGSITTTTSATAYNTTSDYRLKTDAQPMTGASDRVLSLKPVNFAWIADGTRVDGFLAHEAQEVVPEAVHGTKDAVDADGNPDYQGIDQSKLVPLLTAALQEALTKIADMETRLSALET